jgi:hypothetical protein
VPNDPTAAYQPAQVLASNSFTAAAAGTVTLLGKTGYQTVISGVTVTAGIATGTVHGIWTISDGIWTQSYYVFMSATIPMPPVPLTFAPGLMSTNIGAVTPTNANIVITMPAITSGAPYTISTQGFYL